MTLNLKPWDVDSSGEVRVLELIQLVGDVVMFADHRTKPDTAFSVPRATWETLGSPTVITVEVWPGGDFVPKEKPEGALTAADIEAALKPGAYL